jgi:DNA mismatch endonuclease (patch repair protein)
LRTTSRKNEVKGSIIKAPMPDVFTPAKRSEVMSRIRSRGNRSTEERLVALMKEAGITGWRRQVELVVKQARGAKAKVAAVEKVKPLKVRPDFVFRRERVVVFVDGCFWHGCPRHATRPKHNRTFWDAKIAGNKARDARVTRGLRKAGWKVLRIWECALTVKRQPATLNRLRRALTLGMECG